MASRRDSDSSNCSSLFSCCLCDISLLIHSLFICYLVGWLATHSALEEDARAALSARQSFPLRGRSLKLEVAVKAVKQPRKALASTAASEPFQAGEGSDLRAEVQKEQPLEGLQQPSKKKKRALSPEAPAIAKKAMTKSRTEVEGKKGSPEPESEPDPAAEAGPSRQRQLLVLGLPADVSKKGFQQFLLHMKGLRRGSRPLVELIKEVSRVLQWVCMYVMYVCDVCVCVELTCACRRVMSCAATCEG